MMAVALLMFASFLAYWSIDVYLLWADVYQLLPLRQTDLSGEVAVSWIYKSALTPFFIQQILVPLMVRARSLVRYYIMMSMELRS